MNKIEHIGTDEKIRTTTFSYRDFLTSAFRIALAPDDSPFLLRDTGTQEIYALDWEAP